MELWMQVIGMAFLVLVPFTLLVDLHPDRERLDAAGRPLPRNWPGRPAQPPADEHH